MNLHIFMQDCFSPKCFLVPKVLKKLENCIPKEFNHSDQRGNMPGGQCQLHDRGVLPQARPCHVGTRADDASSRASWLSCETSILRANLCLAVALGHLSHVAACPAWDRSLKCGSMHFRSGCVVLEVIGKQDPFSTVPCARMRQLPWCPKPFRHTATAATEG